MTIKELEALVQLAYAEAHRVVIERKKSLVPTWLMIDEAGRIAMKGTPWKDDLEKQITEALIRLDLKDRHAIAYSMVTEAWLALYKDLPEYRDKRPHDRPDRVEVVVAVASDGKNKLMKTWEIKRNHLEQPVKLAEMDPLDEKHNATSWMLNLLDENNIKNEN